MTRWLPLKRRLLNLLWASILVAFLLGIHRVRGFSARVSSNALHQESVSSPIEFIDFWGTRRRRDGDMQNSSNLALPAIPTLDRLDGPLPPEAYIVLGDKKFQPRPICRVILSIAWEQKLDMSEVISQLQSCIDAGFQSFKLVNENNSPQNLDMIGALLQETPKYVEMHWAVRLRLPTTINPLTTREAVFELLSRTQSESLDTIIVPFDERLDTHHHLEVLDTLFDLQRDGYIRSIAVDSWSSTLIQTAKDCGFCIGVHQQRGNLLLPPGPDNDESVAQWWTNPLVGNLLSDDFLGYQIPPTKARGWFEVKEWYEKRNNQQKLKDTEPAKTWEVFQDDVLDVLRYIGWKHEVSGSTIALRWSLQPTLEGGKVATSVVVPLTLVKEPEGQLERQLRGLRDIFRFNLDEEDLEMLQRIPVRLKPKAQTVCIDEVDVPIEDVPLDFLKEYEALTANMETEEFQQGDDEYPKIDFSNPALWLKKNSI